MMLTNQLQSAIYFMRMFSHAQHYHQLFDCRFTGSRFLQRN